MAPSEYCSWRALLIQVRARRATAKAVAEVKALSWEEFKKAMKK